MTASLPDAFQMPSLHDLLGSGPREVVQGPAGLARKRFPTSDLEEFMDAVEADGYLVDKCDGSLSSKRLRGAHGWVFAGCCNSVGQAGDWTSTSPSEVDTGVHSSRKETGNFQTVAKAGEKKIATASSESFKGCFEDASVIHCGDLDDILDILLHETEPVSLEPYSPTTLQSFGSSRISSNDSESSQESPALLVNSQPAQFSISSQLHGRRDLSLASKMSSLQEREQTRSFRDRIPRRSWDWQAPPREQPANASAHTDSFPNCSDSDHSSREERRLNLSVSDISQQPQLKPSGCKRETVQVWAGPTLLEIESALARKDSSPLVYSPAKLNTMVNSALSLSMSDCLEGDAAWQIGSSGVREDGAHSGEFPPNEEQKFSNSWKNLLKRGAGEPKYTLKLRCEEDAVNDGYRWRKYGQKTIKSSPYPRSYYRCTSCKCTAKKQVERSSEDPRLLLVTYDGIHLHPQPNPHANCMSSHLVEHDVSPPPRTSSLSPPSSSSCCHHPTM